MAEAPAGSTYSYRTIVDPLIAAPTAGYCTTTLAIASGFSNQNSCAGSSQNIAYKTTIRFVTTLQNETLTIRAAGDWGFGAALVVDGETIQERWPSTQGSTDANMWWAGSFLDPYHISREPSLFHLPLRTSWRCTPWRTAAMVPVRSTFQPIAELPGSHSATTMGCSRFRSAALLPPPQAPGKAIRLSPARSRPGNLHPISSRSNKPESLL